MQTEGKMLTEDCRSGVKGRLGSKTTRPPLVWRPIVMRILVTWVYTLKFNRGEGWGDSCLSVRFGSASAVQMVEFLSFIPRHESRYEFPVSFLVSIKKMNKVFF